MTKEKTAVFILGLVLCVWPVSSDEAPIPTLHTVFSTECNSYFDWQSLGLMYSHRKVQQMGGFTRLMACDKSPPPGVHIVSDTHVHPNYAVHPRTKDSYSPYNKPYSIMHWLLNAKPTADYIIILDADMVFRKAITAAMLGVEKGRPVSAHYGYLIGIFKENFMKVKERVPNVDKAQQVGGFTVMHREDLEQVAPRWLYWTEEVRQDPQSWSNTGDIFNANGKSGPPWISEMYGYVFACAEVGLNFKVSNNVMLYPGYPPPPEPWPAVLHYGITYNVDEYAFDKHWYMGRSDFTTCPGRVFNKPMLPEDLSDEPGSVEYRRKTVALTVAQSLYEATKWWSGSFCGEIFPDPPKQAYSCNKDASNGVVLCQEVKGTQAKEMLLQRLRGETSQTHESCTETSNDCCGWAATGECDNNPGFMLANCQKSCNLCSVSCQQDCCPPNTPEHSIERSPASLPKHEGVETETTHVVDTEDQELLRVHAKNLNLESDAARSSNSGLVFRETIILSFIAGSLFTSLLMHTFSPHKKLERHKTERRSHRS